MDIWFNKEDYHSQPSFSSASSRQDLSELFRYQAAVSMGCKDGQIEVGMTSTASNNINMQMGISNMFSEAFVQQSSPLGEFFQLDQSWPSSSSSSLRSLSVGSPEYSSLILSKANSTTTTPYMADSNLREPSVEQVIAQPRSAHLVPQVTMQAHGQARHHVQHFPTPTSNVDAAMARAMLAVISSSSSSPPQQNQARSRGRAFQPYAPSPAPKIEAMQGARGQEMMKKVFSMLRDIKLVGVDARAQETRPGSNQSNHVMSERKRREKLNGSFASLRTVLPSGTKGDKASVLANTIGYVNSLKAEISDLEGKNRVMEARLLPLDEADDGEDASGERVRIKIDRKPKTASGWQQIELRVAARVEYCDMIDLVLHMLECLKKVRGVRLVSLDASVHTRQMNPIRLAVLTMQVKGDDWDEGSFKEAIAGAVDEASREV